MEPLYTKSVTCPCCSQNFLTSRVRPSLKKSIRQDADFCMYFKEGDENPEFYVVRVCPFCGFASTENSAPWLNGKQRKAIYENVTSVWKVKDYGGKRTPEDAMYTYKLALLCAQLIDERPRIVAGLLHHIAWLYRYQGDWENEQRFLRHALGEYIRVFESEGPEVKSSRLMFLIGELHRRLKEFPEAVRWFSRVINDKSIMDAGMIKACREGWAAVREEMANAQAEHPEEEMLKNAGN